jgi:hypothetical protein
MAVVLIRSWLPQYLKPVTVSLCPDCYRLCAHAPPTEHGSFVLPGRYGESPYYWRPNDG